jgi:hypothetical protein
MVRSTAACALAGMLLLGACALEPLQPRRPGDAGMTSGSARPPAPSRKEVVEKRDLNMLIARDGTRCTVPEQVFRDTDVGERVTCLWRRVR